jgi:hypothetical protein
VSTLSLKHAGTGTAIPRLELVCDVGNGVLESPNAVGLIMQAYDQFNASQKSTAKNPAPQANRGAEDPFPVHALPPKVRELVLDISRVHRTPPALAACYGLGVISTGIGKGLRLPTTPGNTTSGNLYTIIGAKSGLGKSSVFGPIVAPLREYENQLGDDWLNNQEPQQELEAAKGKKGKLGKINAATPAKAKPGTGGDIEAKPLPMLTCENITSEAMVQQLEQNDECTALISGDGRDPIDIICGRYRKGGQTDEGLLLKGFSEEPYKVSRKTSDPVFLKSPRIVCCLAVQPDKLEELYSKKFARSSGLLARFLPCQLKTIRRPINRSGRGINRQAQRGWNEFVKGLLDEYYFGGSTRAVKVSRKVAGLLYDYGDAITQRLDTDLSTVDEFAVRWAEHAWRLSLVLHVGQHGVEAHRHPLSQETAQDAIMIVDWFSRQQGRLLEDSQDATRVSQEGKVLDLLRNAGQITPRDVQRKRIANGATDAKSLLDRMCGQGMLVCVENDPVKSRYSYRLAAN